MSPSKTLYRRIASSSLYQHKTLYRPPFNFSPLSARNTLTPTAQFLPSLSIQHFIAHRSISSLYQHKTLYRPPPNFSPTQHTTLYRPPLNFSLHSAHNTLSPTAQFLSSLNTQYFIVNHSYSHLSQYTKLYCLPHNFFPLSAHNIESPTANILISLSTQHCITHRSISPPSQHKRCIAHSSISQHSQHTTLYRPPLNFSPL